MAGSITHLCVYRRRPTDLPGPRDRDKTEAIRSGSSVSYEHCEPERELAREGLSVPRYCNGKIKRKINANPCNVNEFQDVGLENHSRHLCLSQTISGELICGMK